MLSDLFAIINIFKNILHVLLLVSFGHAGLFVTIITIIAVNNCHIILLTLLL